MIAVLLWMDETHLNQMAIEVIRKIIRSIQPTSWLLLFKD
jgi:hypothetical protein